MISRASYLGAGVAAIDMHYFLLKSLVRKGVLDQAEVVEQLEACLPDIEERAGLTADDADRLIDLHVKAHVESILSAERAALPPGRRPR